jgi:hypothetical protein
MSEQDDIFDLDHFIKRKGTTSIKDAWARHLSWFNICEMDHDFTGRIIKALGTVFKVASKAAKDI